ncbi:hypothetical protein [Streptomyces sp. NBC_01014]|uniref:hypothetical protein n=1 Tax=Streptomyces sp. NBC_01014 TaxID=2903719 RepID=UPI003868160C|nr:hypothetical protein OG282_22050 [Streptomyces sp. NBC_01014]
MRTGELSAGESPPQAAGSDVTRQLCTALYAHSAHVADPMRLSEARLLRLVKDVLRDPARSVPSYGFDLIPVLTHGVRVRRRQLLRRGVVVAVVGLVVAWAPSSALTWLGALGVAWVLGPSGTGWALLPLVGYWLFTLVAMQKHNNFYELWAHSAQLPFVLAAAVALVYVVDEAVARSARKRASRYGGARERLPFARPWVRRHLASVDARQYGTALPYDVQGRFIGAGRIVRGAAEIRVPLRPRQPERPVVAMRETELLESIGAALTTVGHGESRPGDLTETAPLPGFSVARVLALPADLWLARNRSEAGTSEMTGGLGRPERPYLRAQCVSWQGQLVVSLFAHVALQAGELRLTLRPQVMAPLLPLPEPASRAVFESLRGAAGPWLTLWRRIRKTPAQETDPAGPDTPLSLRDDLSLPEISDLHQRGDAERHVELMQTAVLSAVEALLEHHGFATEAFSDRHTVINSIHVLGDNNAGIQLAGGVTLTQVAQTAPTAPDPASTEGVFMNPGLPHRTPDPEPARTPDPEPAQAPGSGINIGRDNTGTAQIADGHVLSHVTQTGTGQSGVPLDSVAALLTAFRADINRNAELLADPEALRDETTVLAGVLTDPESDGFRPALRMAARSLPALVAGTAVQHTGEALVTAIRGLLG